MSELVILVNEQDEEIGLEEKMKAHQAALLHRAFSVFIYNSDGKMLLQQRADEKYHSGGLWTNACCSHPRKGEAVLEAAHRRLQEEMGFDTDLTELFTFIYQAELDSGLVEYELDHVVVGHYDGTVEPNPEEAKAFRWVEIGELINEVEQHPHSFTVWFKIALNEVLKHQNQSVRRPLK